MRREEYSNTLVAAAVFTTAVAVSAPHECSSLDSHQLPSTQPVQGRNIELLPCLVVLFKSFDSGMRCYCCSVSEPAA